MAAKDKLTGKVAGKAGAEAGELAAKGVKGILNAAKGATRKMKAQTRPQPKIETPPPSAKRPKKQATPDTPSLQQAAPLTPAAKSTTKTGAKSRKSATPAASRTEVSTASTTLPGAKTKTKVAKEKTTPLADNIEAGVVKGAKTTAKKAAAAEKSAAAKKAAAAEKSAAAKKAAPSKPASGGAGKPKSSTKKKAEPTPEPSPFTDNAPLTATDAVTEAAKRRLPRPSKRLVLEAAGISAPGLLDKAEENNAVPDWLKTPLRVAADSAALLAGGSAIRRGFGAKGLATKAGRTALKETEGFFPKLKAVTTGGILPALGAGGVYMAGNPLSALGGGANEAEAEVIPEAPYTPTESYIPPELLPVTPDGQTPDGRTVPEILEEEKKRLEDETRNRKSELDAAYDAALKALTDAYGGIEAANAAQAGNDPILAQQLAAIEGDYQAGIGQIAANYNGALAQIQGYMQQATQIMTGLADSQAASFEAAAGGLEGMSPGVGLGADQAASAGISDTALGGAGVTGAALARSLSGADQAALAAEQMRTQTSLSDQLATGKLSQADLEAALAREALGAKSEARKASAVRESDARIKAQEDKIRVAELTYQTTLDKAKEKQRVLENDQARLDALYQMRLESELSIAEKQAEKGLTANPGFRAPSWIGQTDARPGSTPLTSLGINNPETSKPYTVDDLNSALDTLNAVVTSVAGMSPQEAQANIVGFYRDNAALRPLLAYAGRPTSAGVLLQQLYGSGSAPKATPKPAPKTGPKPKQVAFNNTPAK